MDYRVAARIPGLAIASAAAECRAELAVLMCEVEHRLWQIRRLHDAAHLDGSFVLDEFSDEVE